MTLDVLRILTALGQEQLKRDRLLEPTWLREHQDREERFLRLEQGLEDDVKIKELRQCEIERGHRKGPGLGARGEIFVKDMTPAEVRMTVPSLIKALSIHFEHEAIKPIERGRVIPKDRVIHSRMVIVSKKWSEGSFEPKGRLCVGGHRGSG